MSESKDKLLEVIADETESEGSEGSSEDNEDDDPKVQNEVSQGENREIARKEQQKEARAGDQGKAPVEVSEATTTLLETWADYEKSKKSLKRAAANLFALEPDNKKLQVVIRKFPDLKISSRTRPAASDTQEWFRDGEDIPGGPEIIVIDDSEDESYTPEAAGYTRSRWSPLPIPETFDQVPTKTANQINKCSRNALSKKVLLELREAIKQDRIGRERFEVTSGDLTATGMKVLGANSPVDNLEAGLNEGAGSQGLHEGVTQDEVIGIQKIFKSPQPFDLQLQIENKAKVKATRYADKVLENYAAVVTYAVCSDRLTEINRYEDEEVVRGGRFDSDFYTELIHEFIDNQTEKEKGFWELTEAEQDARYEENRNVGFRSVWKLLKSQIAYGKRWMEYILDHDLGCGVLLIFDFDTSNVSTGTGSSVLIEKWSAEWPSTFLIESLETRIPELKAICRALAPLVRRICHMQESISCPDTYRLETVSKEELENLEDPPTGKEILSLLEVVPPNPDAAALDMENNQAPAEDNGLNFDDFIDFGTTDGPENDNGDGYIEKEHVDALIAELNRIQSEAEKGGENRGENYIDYSALLGLDLDIAAIVGIENMDSSIADFDGNQIANDNVVDSHAESVVMDGSLKHNEVGDGSNGNQCDLQQHEDKDEKGENDPDEGDKHDTISDGVHAEDIPEDPTHILNDVKRERDQVEGSYKKFLDNYHQLWGNDVGNPVEGHISEGKGNVFNFGGNFTTKAEDAHVVKEAEFAPNTESDVGDTDSEAYDTATEDCSGVLLDPPAKRQRWW